MSASVGHTVYTRCSVIGQHAAQHEPQILLLQDRLHE